jgi:hypothetical protein
LSSQPPSVREQVAASTRRLAGVKRADKVSAAVIRLGGVGIVVAVLGILVFILGETAPLFVAPEGRFVGEVRLATPPAPSPTPGGAPAPAAPPPAAPVPAATPAPPAARLAQGGGASRRNL